MLRKLHRWFSLPLILFLIVVLGSGLYLQFEEIGKLGGKQGPRPAAEGAQSYPTDQAITQQLTDALAKAREAEPDFKPSRIELTVAPGRQSTRLAMQPRGGPFVEVDNGTGAVTAEMNPELPLHVVFIRLHTGSIAGALGVWITLAAGIILLFLAISGGVLYWQMWKNRASRGRRALFWK